MPKEKLHWLSDPRMRPTQTHRAIICACLCLLVVGATQVARATEDYFPFVIPWDDAAPTAFNMTELLGDAPAGKHGPLRADGDRLVFQDGTPAKLWGIGMSASSEFPPQDKPTADALIRKLRKYGFNVVRIRAIDAPEVHLYEPWLKSGKLDAKIMDRIDYFIAELGKAGIYYSVGINVTSPRHGARGAVAATQYARAPKRYNGVQLFDETAIDDTVHWYEAILSHVNAYTKVSYAQDPAFVFVPGVAEDSIFHQYFSERDALGEENETALTKLFNRYLVDRYHTREALSTAWQESGKRGLSEGEDPAQGSVAIVPWNEKNGISKARIRDVMTFFYEVDLQYAQRMRDVLRKAGYKGLYTGTNNWFGPGNLLMNHDVGDYVETQAYFDTPAKKAAAEQDARELIGNVSFIAGEARNRPKSVYYGNLYRLFMTATVDRPTIVSEWNHAAWSDYVYEGPLLLTAYASLQGYRGLLIHTYLAKGDVRAEAGNGALVWTGNAVLIALSPTLALAYRRGDVTEATDTVVIPYGGDQEGVMDRAAENGENAQLAEGRIPLDIGFVHKLRVQLPGGAGQTQSSATAASAAGDLKSSTGEILWHRDPQQGVFSVNTARFQAAAGHLETKEIGLRNMSVKLDAHGAVTAIALDDQDVGRSHSILVTAVSSFKNTGEVFQDKTGRNDQVVQRVVKDFGKAPMLLKRVRGTFTLRTALKEKPHVYSLTTAGAVTELSIQDAGASGDLHQYRFELGAQDSPWYWIKL